MIDVYFMRYLSGHDKRIISSIAMVVASIAILGIMFNLDSRILFDWLTLRRLLGIVLIFATIWLFNLNKGMFIASMGWKLWFIRATLIFTAMAMFGVIDLSRILFNIDKMNVGRYLAASLAVSLYFLYKR